MSIGTSASYILLLLIRGPTTGTANSIHLRRIDRVIFIGNFFTVITKKSMHMHTNLEFILIMTKLIVHIPVIFKQRLELCRVPTYDSEDHGQSMFTRTQYRSRGTSHCDPDVKMIIDSTGQYLLLV